MNPSANSVSALEPARAQSVPRQQVDQEIGTPAASAVSKAALKVCLIGLKCYDHIAEKPVPQYLGGIETQLAVLAKGLRHEGCRVSFITFDHGQRDRECFDGIEVFKSYRPAGGIRGLRALSRAKRFLATMRRADADLYLQMGAGSETGLMALGCRLIGRRRRFVFCLASDADCTGPLGAGKWSLESRLYRHGINRADLVVAQTQTQQRNLQNSLGIKSRIIPMAVAARNGLNGCDERTDSVLWVGRPTPEKRLEWFVEAARQCPEIRFNVVGTPNKPSDYTKNLLAAAGTLPNLQVHGRLPQPELDQLFQSCRALCCTSMLEGFPTTFLEAWSCGLPVVTTFDPDGIVGRHGLGRVAKTLDEFVAHLRSLSDAEACSRMSHAAKDYYSHNHSVEAVSNRFRLAFEKLAGS